jgi:2-keto-3-deoxy-L-rhamnonate aldolase RhmA
MSLTDMTDLSQVFVDPTAYADEERFHATCRVLRRERPIVRVESVIETSDALANVAEIAATPALSALFVGPYDLSLSLGLPPGDSERAPDNVSGRICGWHARRCRGR